VEGLHAIPSTIDLAGAEIELVSQFSREMRLRKALDPIREGKYDFILMDCPPSLGLLTVNALAAAEELIVPIQCEYYALEGLGQLLRNVKLVQQNVNPGLRLTGIVLTMFDPRTKLAEQVVEEVRKYFGDRVYDSVIPRTVRLSEAPGYGQPITVYDPRSRGAERYRSLAKEVAEREPAGDPMPAFDDMPDIVPVPAQDPPAPPAGQHRQAPKQQEVSAPSESSTGTETAPPAAEASGERVYEFDLSAPNGGPPGGVTDPARSEPARSEPARSEPVLDPEPGSAVEAVQPVVAEPPSPRSEPAPQPTAVVEVDLPDTALIADLEKPSSPELFDQAPEEEPKKRKWSLFRKGGDR
jgi:MinD-like ATPase involved in chromosome partitioning or flagellar assembly